MRPYLLVAYTVSAEEWLVLVDQSVGIIWNVSSSEDCDHSEDRLRRARVDSEDAGMRTASENDLGKEHAGSNKVRRVSDLTGDLPERVNTGHGFANDGTHHAGPFTPAAAVTACTIFR